MPKDEEEEIEDTSTEEDTTEEDDTSIDDDDDVKISFDGEEEEVVEEDEEEEEKKEEDDGKQYLDLNKVPAPLREAAKRMLATHTKTQQKFKRELEEHKSTLESEFNDKYSGAIVKAEGFDQLRSLPGFDEFYKDIENGKGYGYSSEYRRNNNNNRSADDEDDSGTSNNGVSMDEILKRLDASVKKAVADAVLPLKQERNKSVWEDAEKSLKDFKKYKAEITAIITKHPTMTIEDAYDKASSKDRQAEAIRKALTDAADTSKKIPKKTLKPGSGGKTVVSTKTIKSINDALSMAFKNA